MANGRKWVWGCSVTRRTRASKRFAAPALMVAGPVAGPGGSTFLTDLFGVGRGSDGLELARFPSFLYGGVPGRAWVAGKPERRRARGQSARGELRRPWAGAFLSGIGARLESDNGRAPCTWSWSSAPPPSTDQRGS